VTPAEPANVPVHDPDGDTDMTSTYIKIVVLEILIIAALWLLGRAFA
jgi:hypothetical protein